MCGRFTLSQPGEVLDETLAALDGLLESSEGASVPTFESLQTGAAAAGDSGLAAPRFNVAPTQSVPVLRADDGIDLSLLRWGLARRQDPADPKQSSSGGVHINARAETLDHKPTFRDAFRTRRCLILADGFYEWKKSSRQPFFFFPERRRALVFAGLWSSEPVADGNEGAEACCIVTTAANSLVSKIHDRMPVILEPQDYESWLAPGIRDPSRLAPLLRPAAPGVLGARPVSSRVNRVAFDDPSLIQRAPEAPPDPVNLRLF